MNDVIDIPSSPEPNPMPRPKALPRAKPRQDNETIVLTDSDSDDEPVQRPQFRDRGVKAGAAGPSRRTQPEPLRRHAKDAFAGSLENIPARRRPKAKSVPLFLPSDEENEPPQVEGVDEREPILVDNLPTPPPDPIPGYVAQVLEIIPDVDPEYALSLVKQHYPESRDKVVEPVLHALFEDPAYPKLDKKGKRKRAEEDAQGDARGKAKIKLDYGSKDRAYNGGVHYADLSLDQLMVDFPLIPKPHIRRVLLDHHSLYAPTHIFLAEEKRAGGVLPYVPKTIPSRVTAKGKRKALHDPEFEKERAWIESRAHDDAATKAPVEEEYVDCGDGIECGCCFSTYPFDKMIQCPDAHLFCSECMTTYAETLLGAHDHKIFCMDQDGCKLPFPDAQLRRFLTPKLMSLYERVKQTKEVEAAGIRGLEECPFCDYKCVIENEQEKLFRCGSEDCAAVSCRQCKQLDHLPKSCKEMQEDKNLDGRHTIEEAMTRALMRNCPKCQKAFIKEQGCNKMTCPNCFALSCYICRKLITGYDHFAQQPGQPAVASSSKTGAKCALWDAVEQRHAEEVTEAAKKALEEYKQAHPDINEDNLKVDLPVIPPAPPPPVPGIPAYPGLPAMNYPQIQAQMANAQQWMLAQMQYRAAPAPPPVVLAPAPAPAPAPRRRVAKRPAARRNWR
ncbi:hypothetical protein B0H17DRAFT_238676 [Mycena rosella]|uniref:RING-type domain-containing protein n=1 Tax=Mycena rosella TaxID=1033263 RepID=A0AAD7H1K1_MYCRO|nr:hypothetical protein B0H17DRAFT_238676 [Mycena rosella]